MTHPTAQPTTHTPTPWNLALQGIILDAENHYPIATCSPRNFGSTDGPLYPETCLANAAHIVHCVNTYPALLAALKECITEEGAYCLNHDSKALLRGRLASITLLAKQAIALAEGK